MGFFEGTSTEHEGMDQGQVEALHKALGTGGYGTEHATFVNGHAMIPENLESSMVEVIAATKEDCKVLNSIKTTNVKSTVHEKNRRTGHGDHRFLTVPEFGASSMTDQEIQRMIFLQKFIQTKRSVSYQMEKVETFEPAFAGEKLAGIQVCTKAIEHNIFHGNSAVIPTEFDGFEASIRKSKDPNIIDLRGNTIGSRGESLFDDVARQVWDCGGDIQRVFFPSVLAKSIKELFSDRLRYVPGVENLSFTKGKGLPPYATAVGSDIQFSGEEAGPDKFYQVKGFVKEAGDPVNRPPAPASVALAASTNAGSLFLAADAGDYSYTVHAVNAKGISAGTAASGAVTVAAGKAVNITITPGAGRAATGFIICRSIKGGTDVMEMVQIPASSDSTTVYADLNKDLPGTASMLFTTVTKIQPCYGLGQLLPVSTYPLYPTEIAETPFLVIFFGALEVDKAEFCALVENIHYDGGF
jgi:hypothetical protein